MKSAVLGKNTSSVEVTNISKMGFWLLVGDEELFLPFKNFPWCKTAAVQAVLKVDLYGREHFRWPRLDVDLTLAPSAMRTNIPLSPAHHSNKCGVTNVEMWHRSCSEHPIRMMSRAKWE